MLLSCLWTYIQQRLNVDLWVRLFFFLQTAAAEIVNLAFLRCTSEKDEATQEAETRKREKQHGALGAGRKELHTEGGILTKSYAKYAYTRVEFGGQHPLPSAHSSVFALRADDSISAVSNRRFLS